MIEDLSFLADWARTELAQAFLVFLRVGAAMALLPAFGQTMVPARVRLGLALVFTAVVLPPVADRLPPVGLDGIVGPVLATEVIIGLALGAALRLFVVALQIAGTIAAQSVSLAQIFGATTGADPQPAIGSIMTISGIALAVMMDLHLKVTIYLVGSYDMLPPGVWPAAEDSRHLGDGAGRLGLRPGLRAGDAVHDHLAGLQPDARDHQPRHAAAHGRLRRRAGDHRGRPCPADGVAAAHPERLAVLDGRLPLRSDRGRPVSGEDEAEKSHEPSQKKLDDARKKGEVPRSTDLNTAATYGGILLVMLVLGGQSLRGIGEALSRLIAEPDRLALHLGDSGGAALMGGLLQGTGASLVPWVVAPMALALASIFAQRAFTVSTEKLKPKMSKISPLSNAKQKFGASGLFEFAKSTVKLTIYSAILFVFLARSLPDIVSLVTLDPAVAMAVSLRLVVTFMWIVLAIAIVIGVVDFFWQRNHHLQKHRMSRKELVDEQKDSEGDPHMKQERRQRGQEIAMNQMLADVPDAAVVITNPTHYAVALKWNRGAQGAPVCVAKGVDHVAARVREAAEEAGVPIRPDPPTARALHGVVEIGEEIRPEHYAAVAVSIRFAEDMRRKARAR